MMCECVRLLVQFVEFKGLLVCFGQAIRVCLGGSFRSVFSWFTL